MKVSYEKAMRERAKANQTGLYTLEIINASKKPGKLGGRMTLQGPANADDYKEISEFMLSLLKRQAARESSSKERPAR